MLSNRLEFIESWFTPMAAVQNLALARGNGLIWLEEKIDRERERIRAGIWGILRKGGRRRE